MKEGENIRPTAVIKQPGKVKALQEKIFSKLALCCDSSSSYLKQPRLCQSIATSMRDTVPSVWLGRKGCWPPPGTPDTKILFLVLASKQLRSSLFGFC